MKVTPTSGTYVTIKDVVQVLHHKLWLSATEGEYRKIPTHEMQLEVDNAYQRRYKREAEKMEYERQRNRGVMRVDFLAGENLFAGLSSTTMGPDVWELNVLPSKVL
jgi:hypothetical protein